MDKKLHNEFCQAVNLFLKDYAELCIMKNQALDGEVLDNGSLERLLEQINGRMPEIERLEALLGYESVGIPMEDANFEGFSIVNGELQGTTVSNAYLIAQPWVCQFWDAEKTSASDCYKFFVGIFLYYMAGIADSSVMDELAGRKESEANASEKEEKRGKENTRKVFYFSDWLRRNRNLFSERVQSLYRKKPAGTEIHSESGDCGRRCG